MNEKWDRRFLALAAHIAAWSKDPVTTVGCVIVGPDREIRSTGDNGLPRGVVDNPTRMVSPQASVDQPRRRERRDACGPNRRELEGMHGLCDALSVRRVRTGIGSGRHHAGGLCPRNDIKARTVLPDRCLDVRRRAGGRPQSEGTDNDGLLWEV